MTATRCDAVIKISRPGPKSVFLYDRNLQIIGALVKWISGLSNDSMYESLKRVTLGRGAPLADLRSLEAVKAWEVVTVGTITPLLSVSALLVFNCIESVSILVFFRNCPTVSAESLSRFRGGHKVNSGL